MGLSKTKQYYVAGGAAVIIVIALGFFTYARMHTKQMASNSTKALSDIVAATSSAVSVADQSAGTSVALSRVQVSAFSWVAVRDEDGNHVLGAARFLPGESEGVVPLLRATEAGKTYEVVIYTDNGDHAFDMHKDALESGVRATFTAR